MKSLVVAVTLLASLSGCYQITSAGDVGDATKICGEHGGINHITVLAFGDEFVVCQDEFVKHLHSTNQ
jgi:hypothetical protein